MAGRLLKNSEFCTGKTDPLDEGTLCKEEDENDWQGDYKRCSHQVGPLHIICAAEQAQSELKRVKRLVMQENQGGQKVIPGGLEGENRHSRKRRA